MRKSIAKSLWAVCLSGLLLAPGLARAALLGGIEIGAKGIKATVINTTPSPRGMSVKILLSGTYNTTLVSGIASSGKFDAKGLADTASAVKRFAEQMESKHKVPKDSIYVVGSSGLFTPIAGDAKAVAANKEALTKAVRGATGRTLDFISVQQEAYLSIAGIVPIQYRDTSILVDIGSGNTKGGYWVKANDYATFGVPFGSVTFTDRMKKLAGKGSLAAASERLSKESLRPDLKAAVSKTPGLKTRQRVYLSGGACWALTTFARPADRSPYVVLTAKDIKAYHKALVANPGKYPVIDLSTVRDEAARAEAEKDLARLKKTFTPEQLLAGAEILVALADEFDMNADRSIAFSRNGYLGWILAYAARKGGKP